MPRKLLATGLALIFAASANAHIIIYGTDSWGMHVGEPVNGTGGGWGFLPESGIPYYNFRLVVYVTGGQDWTEATLDLALNGPVYFYQHPGNDSDPPNPMFFTIPGFKDSEYTCYFTSPGDYPNGPFVGGVVGFARRDETPTTMHVEFFDTIDTGPGHWYLVSLTVVPEDPLDPEFNVNGQSGNWSGIGRLDNYCFTIAPIRGVRLYADRAEFRWAVRHMTLVGTETFEELEPGYYPFPPGLQGPHPEGEGNILAPMALYAGPAPAGGLYATDFGGDIVVGPEYFSEYTEADFGAMPGPEIPEGPYYGDYYGVAFHVMAPIMPGPYGVNVYDLHNRLMGNPWVYYGASETFYGLVADTPYPIGRIEFASWDLEAVDDFELYRHGCPEPGASGQHCTADVYPNNGDRVWNYAIDGDCVVGLDDLAHLLANYDPSPPRRRAHEEGDVWPEDGDGVWEDGVDGDGVINLADLAEMLSQYGDRCAVEPPPP